MNQTENHIFIKLKSFTILKGLKIYEFWLKAESIKCQFYFDDIQKCLLLLSETG